MGSGVSKQGTKGTDGQRQEQADPNNHVNEATEQAGSITPPPSSARTPKPEAVPKSYKVASESNTPRNTAGTVERPAEARATDPAAAGAVQGSAESDQHRALGGGRALVEATVGQSLIRSKGQLRDIPREATNMEGLTYLDLSWNQISSVSSGAFQMLQDLEFLDLSFNGLEKLPESVSYLSVLKVLRLSGNNLEQLPMSIGTMSLVELYADANKLTEFPKELKGIRSLRVLDLTGNKITHVGRTLGTLRSMEHLSLDKNHIKTIPSDIGKLILLRTLRLAHNELDLIPLELGLCMCLEELDVAHNNLKYIPSQLSDCRRLKYFRASHNKIKVLPDEFGFFGNMEEFYLSDNELLELPKPVQWTKIQVVDVRNNDLTSIPSALGFTNTIRKVEIAGNPRLRIPRAVLEAGTKCLASYLQTIGEQHRLIDEHIQRFNDPYGEGGDPEPEQASPPADTEATFKAQVNSDAALDGRQQVHGRNQEIAVNRLATMAAAGAAGSKNDMVPIDERRKQRQREVEMIKDYLMSDPTRYRRIMATRKDRQKMFKEESERTRRMLVARGLTYGNQMMQMISKALDSKILVLRSMGLRAIPPEVDRITGLTVADLTGNQLKVLDGGLMTTETIEVLNLSRNLLEALPADMDLPNLHILHVGFNALRSLPSTISRSADFEVLIASNNQLEDLPSEVGILPLTDLYLSENLFKDIPYCLWSVRSLEKLSFACNSLVMVPPEIGLLTNLRFLDLSFNMIAKLPAEMENLAVLERLNLSFNPLGPGMPPVLFTLPSLIELNLDYTGVREISARMGDLLNLEGLQLEGNRLAAPYDALYKKNPLLLVAVHNEETRELDMSYCNLTVLPPFIGKLQKLVSLDLRGNNLTTLPVELGQCKALTHLELEGNPLEYPFSHVVRPPYGALAAFHLVNDSVTTLDLSNCNLPDLPDTIVTLHGGNLLELNLAQNALVMLPYRMAELTNLQRVVVDGNKLTDFPGVLCSIVTLQSIQLSNNEIRDVPDTIVNLTQLTSLVLDSNHITSLPVNLGRLTALEVLSVPDNKIKTLPDIRDMKNLRMLDISCNDLSELPSCIGALSKLEVLDARINQFADLPEELGYCESLRLLSLSNNQLSRLPDSLGQLKRLSVLRLGANGLTRLPYPLCLLNDLEEIQLVGNPLPTVPSELNVRGTDRCRRLLMFYSKIFEPLDAAVIKKNREARSSILAQGANATPQTVPNEDLNASLSRRKSIHFQDNPENTPSAPPGRDYSVQPMPSLDATGDVGLPVANMATLPAAPGGPPPPVPVRPTRPNRKAQKDAEAIDTMPELNFAIPPPSQEFFTAAATLPPPPEPTDGKQRPLYDAF